MARLPRKFLKVFARDASNNGVFGSAADNTKILSNDVEVIQSKPAWLLGWLPAVIGTRKFPTLEEFQSCNYVNTSQIAYVLQEGIPEWDANTDYFQKSIVKKSGTYELYGSITDSNIGNMLSDTDNWEFLIDLSIEQKIPYGVCTGAANTYSVTTAPLFDSYEGGAPFLAKINATNTGASTINANSIGDTPIYSRGQPLSGDELVGGSICLFVYDSDLSVIHLIGGGVPFASSAETIAGSISTKAVTPYGLATLTATELRRGLVELATSPETIAGLDSDRAITPAGLVSAFSNQKTTSGYQNLANGLILQWGTSQFIPAVQSDQVNFNTPFPNGCLQVFLTPEYGGTTAQVYGTTYFVNNSNFRINNVGLVTVQFRWWALGH